MMTFPGMKDSVVNYVTSQGMTSITCLNVNFRGDRKLFLSEKFHFHVLMQRTTVVCSQLIIIKSFANWHIF